MFSCEIMAYVINRLHMCYDNHLLQGQIITQMVNLLEWISSENFTRELNKEPLLN